MLCIAFYLFLLILIYYHSGGLPCCTVHNDVIKFIAIHKYIIQYFVLQMVSHYEEPAPPYIMHRMRFKICQYIWLGYESLTQVWERAGTYRCSLISIGLGVGGYENQRSADVASKTSMFKFYLLAFLQQPCWQSCQWQSATNHENYWGWLAPMSTKGAM